MPAISIPSELSHNRSLIKQSIIITSIKTEKENNETGRDEAARKRGNRGSNGVGGRRKWQVEEATQQEEQTHQKKRCDRGRYR